MPHYADGTEAKVGDHVTGKFFNTEGIRAGTIISITPGVESCNAQIAFTEAVPMPTDGTIPASPGMAIAPGLTAARVVRSERHGSDGALFALFACADYCDTNKLTKVGS